MIILPLYSEMATQSFRGAKISKYRSRLDPMFEYLAYTIPGSGNGGDAKFASVGGRAGDIGSKNRGFQIQTLDGTDICTAISHIPNETSPLMFSAL